MVFMFIHRLPLFCYCLYNNPGNRIAHLNVFNKRLSMNLNPKQQKRLWIGTGLLLSSALIIAFILLALNENIHLYYTPTQIANHEAPLNRPIRMGGIVVPDSVHRAEEGLEVTFDLTDGVNQITVSYTGILPDLFREGQGIVTTGQLKSNHKLVASQVLAKHDENYMPKEVWESMRENQHDS